MTRRERGEALLAAAPVGSHAVARPSLQTSSDAWAQNVGRLEFRRIADVLTTESAAYLTGAYAETVASHGLVVPAWAWTNLLAHGSTDALRRQAQALDRGLLHTRAWLAARGYLAAELIERVDHGASLAQLQREVLIPLELRLIAAARVQPRGGLSVIHWVVDVRTALAQHDAVAARSAGSRAPR